MVLKFLRSIHWLCGTDFVQYFHRLIDFNRGNVRLFYLFEISN
jgi:hypothetical protein